METEVHKIDMTNYTVHRHFGTKKLEELITDSVENICNSAILLTSHTALPYNIYGSVEEVEIENR